MGSDIHLVVVGGAGGLADWAESRIAELEARWSRFRADSEISRWNAQPGRWVEVSADTAALVERATEAWRLTGGGFDATVLPDVVAAGYDRSFDGLPADAPRPPAGPVHVRLISGADVEVDGHAVRLPEGAGFDPGGIGKGLAADLLVTGLIERGAAGACANMGGDLRLAGSAPDGGTWTVAVDHPHCRQPIALVGLGAGAVATSTVLRRTWRVGGELRHHLIDPATGRPSESDVELASVVAGEAWLAEVLAKAILLRGTDRAFDIVEPGQASALIVDRNGRMQSTPTFSAFTGGVALSGTIVRDLI